MPKRPDGLESLQMALEMVRRIPKGRSVTAAELQQQLADAGFERDMRTIQRQLETLSEYFDLERNDTSKPYRYSWKERAKGLSLPGLSAQESLLLTLAEQQLRKLLPARLLNSMQGFFTQAREQLNDPKGSAREKAWIDKVRVVSTSQPLLPPKVDAKVFEEVSNALYADVWLDVGYTNAAGKAANHRVMPLGLAQQGPRMYLICRFEDYDNERSLALHRMQSAQATTFTFERPPEFNLEQYDNDGRFGFGNGERIQLNFRIDKDFGFHLLESPLSEDQQVKELDDEYDITATVVDSAMLDWWLRGFGDAISFVGKKRENA
ncbi:MAG: WYL domain-containing protein [Rhodoferax sp.]|nr:WYL domain-containing protein [Rhodoferax sp.]